MSAHDHDEPAVLSVLAEELAPEAPPPALRRDLLARLHGDERYAPFASEVAGAFGLPVAAVREAFARVAQPDAWTHGPWPGSQLLITPALAGGNAVLARLPAGTRIGDHTHPRRELTYVLDGALIEETVRELGPGELLTAEPGSSHALKVSDHGDCLVVFSQR